MLDPAYFPVYWPRGIPLPPGAAHCVPWRWIEQYEEHAQMLFGHTLEHIADLGGMDVRELWAVANLAHIHETDDVDMGTCMRWMARKPWAS